jgi:hypothetical protein
MFPGVAKLTFGSFLFIPALEILLRKLRWNCAQVHLPELMLHYAPRHSKAGRTVFSSQKGLHEDREIPKLRHASVCSCQKYLDNRDQGLVLNNCYKTAHQERQSANNASTLKWEIESIAVHIVFLSLN